MCEDCKKEKCDCKKDVFEIDLTTLLNWLEKTGADNIEAIFTISKYPGREIYYGIREKREDEQGEDC
jgi:hypothetical protein